MTTPTMDDVKIGDSLVTFGSYHGRARFNKVVRVTATQITIDNGTVVSKKTHREVGQDRKTYGPHYHVGTLEHLFENEKVIRRETAASKFSTLTKVTYSNSYTVEQMEAVIAILEEKGPQT